MVAACLQSKLVGQAKKIISESAKDFSFLRPREWETIYSQNFMAAHLLINC